LFGEQAAIVAFRAAHLTPAPQQQRRSVFKAPLATHGKRSSSQPRPPPRRPETRLLPARLLPGRPRSARHTSPARRNPAWLRRAKPPPPRPRSTASAGPSRREPAPNTARPWTTGLHGPCHHGGRQRQSRRLLRRPAQRQTRQPHTRHTAIPPDRNTGDVPSSASDRAAEHPPRLETQRRSPHRRADRPLDPNLLTRDLRGRWRDRHPSLSQTLPHQTS
jgi:hypothetical protein